MSSDLFIYLIPSSLYGSARILKPYQIHRTWFIRTCVLHGVPGCPARRVNDVIYSCARRPYLNWARQVEVDHLLPDSDTTLHEFVLFLQTCFLPGIADRPDTDLHTDLRDTDGLAVFCTPYSVLRPYPTFN